MWHRFSPLLRQALQTALRFADRADAAAPLSTYDLLCGLCAVGGAGASVLQRLGFDDSALSGTVDEPGIADGSRRGLTLPARAAVERAYDEAVALGDGAVGTEHLLLGLLRTPESAAARVLGDQGITVATAGSALLAIHPLRLRSPVGVPDAQAGRRRLRTMVRRVLDAGVTPALQAGYALANLRRDPLLGPLLAAQTAGRVSLAPLYSRLHARGFYRSSAGGGWVVAGYEDAARALREPDLSARRFDSERGLPGLLDREFNALTGGLSRMMLFTDAPEQTRLRSRLSRRFTPRVIEAMRAQITATTGALLDAAESRGERMDVVTDFAFPLPATVIARLLGVCENDLNRFKQWSDDFVTFLRGTGTLADDLRAHRSLTELTVYFRRAVAETAASPPADTLLSLLVHSEDEEGRLSVDEVVVNCLLLLAAGHETTTHLIANAILLLLRYPEQRRRLEWEPTLLPNAVDEVLRFDSVVQWTSRIVLRPIAWTDGLTLQPGDFVYIGLGAANRDPSRFDSPERFDIGRENAGRNLAFGFGPHFCLGAALARMEAEIALGMLLQRYPRLRPAWSPWSPPRRRRDFTFRALTSLPVILRQ